MKSKFPRISKKVTNFIYSKIAPKGLLARSLLIVVLPLIFVQIVVAVFFYEQHWYTVSRRMADNISSDISMVISMMRELPSDKSLDDLFLTAQRNLGMHFFFVKDGNLPAIEPIEDSIEIYSLRKSIRNRFYGNFAIEEGSKGKSVTVFVKIPEGVLGTTVSKKHFFSSTAYVFSAWLFGSSLLLFIIALLFMRMQVRSIRRLAKAADSFGKGHEVERFKPEGAREVRQAALAFISMRDRIKRQLDERTTMLAGVSHDLRTPLTRMKLELAMMKKTDGIKELTQDVSEMESMVEGYLAFARGEGKEPFQMTEVSRLVSDVVAKIRRTGDIKIDLYIEEPQNIMLRPNDFSRCISNILGNANRYADYAAVNVGVRDKFIEITVDDDGEGIPEKDRNDVFKAFFRLDASRNSQTGGVGLGLTITRDIVLAHGGEISLAQSPFGGLRVILKFPL